MSKRAFSRSFDIPTIDPDKEDEILVGGIKIERVKPFEVNDIWIREYFATIPETKCPVVAKSGCDHDWTSYTGLSESFEFCKYEISKVYRKASRDFRYKRGF